MLVLLILRDSIWSFLGLIGENNGLFFSSVKLKIEMDLLVFLRCCGNMSFFF